MKSSVLLLVLLATYTLGQNITNQPSTILQGVPEFPTADIEGLPADPATFETCAPEQDCKYICRPYAYRYNCPPSCYCYPPCPITPPPGCRVADLACKQLCANAGFNNAVICPGVQFQQCTCYC